MLLSSAERGLQDQIKLMNSFIMTYHFPFPVLIDLSTDDLQFELKRLL